MLQFKQLNSLRERENGAVTNNKCYQINNDNNKPSSRITNNKWMIIDVANEIEKQNGIDRCQYACIRMAFIVCVFKSLE